MKWNSLNTTEQLQSLLNESDSLPILIFKHSTRCSISQTVLHRLERNWKEEDHQLVKPYFLDLLSYREISNQIAQQFNVEHESPQVIIIKKGEVIFHTSHFGIDYSSLKKNLEAKTN